MKKNYFLLFALFALNIANAQWTQTSLDSTQVTSLVVSGSDIFAGTYSGVYLSTNNGNDWSIVNTGLTSTYIYSLAISGNNIYAGTNNGVYLSSDKGLHWTAVNAGLPTNTLIQVIAIKNNNIFIGTWLNGMYLSLNYGNSWISIDSDLTGYSVNALVFKGDTIFAGTLQDGVYFSANNGNNWIKANYGLPSNSSVYSFTNSGNNIFAGIHGGVFLSSDNGNNWIAVNTIVVGTSIKMADNNVNSLILNDSDIYAGTTKGYVNDGVNGVFMSSNNGNSWNLVNQGMPINAGVTALAINGDYIFAGTSPFGVWKRSLSEMNETKEIKNHKNNFTVYPNPVDNKLIIEFFENKNERLLIIHNINGQELIKQKIVDTKTRIDISNLTSGIYFVKLITDKSVEVQKIIKE